MRRAQARRAVGDPKGALALIEKHLAARPHDPGALFEKSRILYELGRRPESLETRLRALELKGAATDAAVIAEMLMEDGLTAEAEVLLRARLDADDEQFTTRFTLAKLLLFEERFLEAEKEIEELYKRSRPAPLVRADYLAALRLAFLGDDEGLKNLVERLRKNRVAPERLEFFESLLRFLEDGDADRFSADLARFRWVMRRNPVYESLYRSIDPERILGAESRVRNEFRKVLGGRWRSPRIRGANFSNEDRLIVNTLFARYTAVQFSPIEEPNTGYSGDRVFRVLVEGKGYQENSCLLKIGPKQRVAVEREKMALYVENKLHPAFHPRVLGFSATRRRAGMRLNWAAVDDEKTESLRQMYLTEDGDSSRVEQALHRLIKVVLRGWYAKNTRHRAVRITPRLAEVATRLRRYLASSEEYRGQVGEERISLKWLGAVEKNPIYVVEEAAERFRTVKLSVPVGLRHGDLNSRNILIDSVGQICLIDFYKAGPGFVLFDGARLEADFRYEVEKVSRESVAELRWMDRSLATATTIRELERLDVRRSMEKRLRMATVIRRLFQEEFSMEEKDFFVAYSAALVMALSRLLGYGHLDALRQELILAEIVDLCHGVLAI